MAPLPVKAQSARGDRHSGWRSARAGL